MKEKRPHLGLQVSSNGMLIVAARRLIRQLIGERVESFDLTPHQYWAILVLHDAGPLCLTDLAASMWMDDPTISRMVKHLHERGILKVEGDPNHGRRIVITLSAEGEKLWAKLNAIGQDFRSKAEIGLSAAERQTMRKCLSQLILNMEDMMTNGITPMVEVIKPRKAKPRLAAVGARSKR
jgi:DNA-binding MarR family transcriptional regulator